MSFSLSGLPPLPKSLSGLLNIAGDSSPHESQPSPRPPLPRTQPPSSSLYANVTSANSSASSRARSRDSLSSPHDFDERNSRRASSVSNHGEMRSSSVGGRATSVPAAGLYMNSAESPHGGRKTTNLDTQLAFLRKEMVSLRQIDMSLLCQLWSLNETIQEFKAQQSRHSSLSPHGWLDHEEEQELDSDGSDEEDYYNQQYGHPADGAGEYVDDNYSQPYRSQEEAVHTNYRNGQMDPRNGHGSSASRLRPVPEHERQYRTGSNSSVEYGDI